MKKIEPKRVWAWYREGRDASEKFRAQAQVDSDYYDGDQWSQEEKEELRERKQPPLVINRIKPTLDLVLGTEVKSKVEFRAVPRSGKHVDSAALVTESLKHAMSQNQGEFECSQAFESQCKAGWGFLEVGKNDDPFKDPVYIGFVPRNDMLWDPYAKKYDLSDARYMIRAIWMDLDIAQDKFPQFKDKMKQAIDGEEEDKPIAEPHIGSEDQSDRPGVREWDKIEVLPVDWLDKQRERVKILEIWYQIPDEIYVAQNDLTGDVDEVDPEAIGELMLNDPFTRIRKVKINRIRVALLAGKDVLEDNPSPFRHNRYPFIPFFAYIKDKDNSPYGIIRQIRDSQDEINKRRSKAMHHLNSRQITATSDVIDKKQNDWKDIAAEAAKPDGVMLLDSASVKGGGQFKIEYGMELARAQHVFEQEAKGEIEQISGVMGELKGAETNASSGRAIISRQVQGTTMLAKLFDNYRRSRHLLGEILWATVQQLYTKPMHFRIRDQQGGYNFIDANTYVTDGSRILIQNDISKAEVDIVIDEQVFHATVRQAFFEQMMAMLGQLPPEIGLMLLPMAIEYSDLPQKDEMVRQIIEAKNLLMQRMGGGQPNQPKLPGGSPEGESLDRERQGIENTMLGGQGAA